MIPTGRIQLYVITTVSLFCAPMAVADDEAEWKVGLTSAKITPEEPVRMTGYGSKELEQPSEGVAADLYAKAMAVEDASGHRSLLITTDLIGLTSDVAEPIYERITMATGLRRDQILINSSHTHTGPALGLDAEQLKYLKNPTHVDATILTREDCPTGL